MIIKVRKVLVIACLILNQKKLNFQIRQIYLEDQTTNSQLLKSVNRRLEVYLAKILAISGKQLHLNQSKTFSEIDQLNFKKLQPLVLCPIHLKIHFLSTKHQVQQVYFNPPP